MKLSGAGFCATPECTSLVVLLHGWGASADNLIVVGQKMSDILSKTLFVAPNAPYPCTQVGSGYEWFSLLDRSEQKMLDGLRNAEIIVNKFIDAKLREFSLDDSRLILAGFSQGAMLAIRTALCRIKKCAGVVAYSGAVVAPEFLATDMRSRPPVCLVHGTDDHVVPFSAFEEAVEFFEKNHVPISAHKLEKLEHSIDSRGMNAAAHFIKQQLEI